jgi:hypothetical protein
VAHRSQGRRQSHWKQQLAFAAAHFEEPVWIFAAASAGMLAFAIVSIRGLAPRRV